MHRLIIWGQLDCLESCANYAASLKWCFFNFHSTHLTQLLLFSCLIFLKNWKMHSSCQFSKHYYSDHCWPMLLNACVDDLKFLQCELREIDLLISGFSNYFILWGPTFIECKAISVKNDFSTWVSLNYSDFLRKPSTYWN